MLKAERQAKLLELIQQNELSKQDELAALLEANGISINQSSVSRDLDELGIIKVNGYYAVARKTNLTNYGLYSLEAAGENMIVAKCESGFAAAACVRIDKRLIHEIIGTIAGEDTIFIAVRNHKQQKTALKKIWEIFEK